MKTAFFMTFFTFYTQFSTITATPEPQGDAFGYFTYILKI